MYGTRDTACTWECDRQNPLKRWEYALNRRVHWEVKGLVYHEPRHAKNLDSKARTQRKPQQQTLQGFKTLTGIRTSRRHGSQVARCSFLCQGRADINIRCQRMSNPAQKHLVKLKNRLVFDRKTSALK